MGDSDIILWTASIATHNDAHNYPYTSSISSSASSSSSSVFSINAPSSQSSTTSSSTASNALGIVWEAESDSSQPGDGEPGQQSTCAPGEHRSIKVCARPKLPPLKTQAGAIGPDQRLNPRRTSRPDVQTVCGAAGFSRPPPALIRQSDRKVNFVDSLVDSAAQLVEVIWPLSVVATRCDSNLGAKGVLPLRTFIQETLRRSRTSYSTLQVALYYLIILKPHVPKRDFTMEQADEGQGARAVQCGRRMFLAALILASKYLQDRNYSARAWSKISGLNTQEINSNEMLFLSIINWRLHISEPVFQRWTDIVLKYTPSAPPPPSPSVSPIYVNESRTDWISIIPSLTPELDSVDLEGSTSAGALFAAPRPHDSPSKMRTRGHETHHAPSGRTTPTLSSLYTIPRVLEPQPCDLKSPQPPLPPLSRLGPLPTPQLTPQSDGFNTPAVSAGATFSRRSSISSAMAQIQGVCTSRTTMDRWSSFQPAQAHSSGVTASPPSLGQQPYTSHRRSSLAKSCSSASSPESMVSDTSSRSSRSSSISSVSSVTCAPNQAKLAVQATCRSAKMNQRVRKENVKSDVHVQAGDDGPVTESWVVTASPESCLGPVSEFSKFSLVDSVPSHLGMAGGRHIPFPPTFAHASSKGRKRGRTSDDPSALQRQVQKLISLDSHAVEVKQDALEAKSQALAPRLSEQSPTCRSPCRLPLQKEMGRKRACCNTDSMDATQAALLLRGRRRAPGMWEGIL